MKKFLFLIVTIIFTSCSSINFPTTDTLNERDDLRSRRSYICDDWVAADKAFDQHFFKVLLGVDGANYYPVWFDSIGSVMDAVIFEPVIETRGTVLLIHGYAGNMLGFSSIINQLVKNGFRVASLSLPGHGLAEGGRGDIDNFNNYGVVVRDFISLLNKKGINPEYAVTHSTGCTSIIIYNQNYNSTFDKVVFIAPLVRSVSWHSSKFVRFLTKPFIKYFNTQWTGPMAVQVFPLHWFDELVKWNKTLKDYQTSNKSLLILQGKKDNVVDWKYNLPKIRKLYPKATTVKYENGSHTMFMVNENESSDISENILEYLTH